MPVKEQLVTEAVTWIDVTDPSTKEMEDLSTQHNLNQYTVRDCLQPEHLPKYEYDDGVQVHFLILRYYAHVSGKQIANIQELTNKIAIFYTETTIITIHISATHFLEIIAKRFANRPTNTTELLARIAWQALETFDEPANRLSEQLDFYESQVLLKKESRDVTEAMYYLKRQASVAHKVLLLMQEPINHININGGIEAYLQDVRDQHLKMQTFYGQILDDVNNLINLSMSFAAQRTNDVMRILMLFSVFFMPLTFIVGIYGMNFEFMPELKQKWDYPAVLILMLSVSAIIYSWFKRKKWM